MNDKLFICPECGSNRVGEMALVETQFVEADPWSAILQRYRCGKCRAVVPGHLAERWDGISAAEAQKEWREIFRASQPD